MIKTQVSIPFASTVISLVTLLGVTLLMVQMLAIQDFLLEQYVKTNDRVSDMRERTSELSAQVDTLQQEINAYVASDEQP